MKTILEYISVNIKPSIIKATDETIKDIVKDEIERLGDDANLNHIDVSKVTDFSYCFFNRRHFNGDISKWDVSKMKNCSFMFSAGVFNCDLGEWNVSNCECFDSMFNENIKFEGHGLDKWNIKKAKSADYMFHKCKAFTGESIIDWKIPNSLKSVKCMFKYCENLHCNLSNWNLSNISIKSKSEIFDYASKMIPEYYPKGINPNLVKAEFKPFHTVSE